MNILFVDDDADARDLVGLILEEGGYNVVCVESGAQALDILKNNDFSLIITDLKMPEMNGLELSKIISEEYQDAKIVMLTGHSDGKAAMQAIDIGIERFLVKPIKHHQLIEVVSETLNDN